MGLKNFGTALGGLAGLASGLAGNFGGSKGGDSAYNINKFQQAIDVNGGLYKPNLFFVEIERQAVSDNYFILGIAGLLVGFGSSYGNGCTSGHGVCGLSRGSTRSIIATVTFMFTGFLTVYILRNTLGL